MDRNETLSHLTIPTARRGTPDDGPKHREHKTQQHRQPPIRPLQCSEIHAFMRAASADFPPLGTRLTVQIGCGDLKRDRPPETLRRRMFHSAV